MNAPVNPENVYTAEIWKNLTAEQKLALCFKIVQPEMSAQQLTVALRRHFGVDITRNAVIGLASRAGLMFPGLRERVVVPSPPIAMRVPKAPEPIKRVRIDRGYGTSTNKAQPMPKLDLTKPPKCKPVAFIDTTDKTCKWPLSGEPGPQMKCCGAPTELRGKTRHSYCAYHRKLGKGYGTRSEQNATSRAPVRPASSNRAGVIIE